MEKIAVQTFLKDRIIEILHKETLDSYRLRNHNVFTSLVELRDTISRWNQNKVKQFETVKCLGEECLDYLKKDDILSCQLYDRELLIDELKEYLNQNYRQPNQKINERIIFCLNQCINENQDDFLKKLLKSIQFMLDKASDVEEGGEYPYLAKLDYYISSFCVQLTYLGYSKQHLFLTIRDKSKNSFEEFSSYLLDLAQMKTENFTIIWDVQIRNSKIGDLEKLGFSEDLKVVDSIIERLQDRFTSILAHRPSHYYYTDQIKDLDIYSAMKKSRENLMRLFDNIHFGAYDCSLNIPVNAIVCKKQRKGWYITSIPSGYFMDGSFSNDFSTTVKYSSALNGIYQNDFIASAVKVRLRSAIRHLSCGDSDTELEQRFINYWIALEFIFASPQTAENTYSRLSHHLVDVLASSYVRRNIDYLRHQLVNESIIDDAFEVFSSAAEIDKVADKADISLLWFYRLKQIKSALFNHTDDRKAYYQKHITNIDRHIARIYSLRNALVHEGALNQDLENITSNLRYYLVFLLDQIISYFEFVPEKKNAALVTLDDFFNKYICYRKMIERNYDLADMLSVPVSRNLW